MTSGAVDSKPCRGYKRNPERPRQRKVAIAEFNEFLVYAKNRGGSSYLVALIGCCVALIHCHILGRERLRTQTDGRED